MERELRIAEWPAEERPRERLYHKGAAALSDVCAELRDLVQRYPAAADPRKAGECGA